MKLIDQYHKWVEWSEEDQVYIGKCPISLPESTEMTLLLCMLRCAMKLRMS